MFDDTTAANEMATYAAPAARVGFFTDTTLCIGCKACEVACKEWNEIPADGMTFTAQSYDNTGELSAQTWRHVSFIEQMRGGADHSTYETEGRWLMSSDVCKHCTHAACLEVCPTGSLMRSEFGTVVVQQDICNGCGYCVPACPYGVIGKDHSTGRAAKCTLCYDRLKDDETPSCAKACPTQSIQYGELDELRTRADARLAHITEHGGHHGANLYGRDEATTIGGAGAFFLLLDKPEVYGMPPDPIDTTSRLGEMWRHAAYAGIAMLGAVVIASIGTDK